MNDINFTDKSRDIICDGLVELLSVLNQDETAPPQTSGEVSFVVYGIEVKAEVQFYFRFRRDSEDE